MPQVMGPEGCYIAINCYNKKVVHGCSPFLNVWLQILELDCLQNFALAVKLQAASSCLGSKHGPHTRKPQSKIVQQKGRIRERDI